MPGVELATCWSQVRCPNHYTTKPSKWPVVAVCFVLDVTVTSSLMPYNCCLIPYSQVKMTVELRRKALYYIINLALPCCVFSVLSIITFVLPPACGERIGVGQNTHMHCFNQSVNQSIDHRRTMYEPGGMGAAAPRLRQSHYFFWQKPKFSGRSQQSKMKTFLYSTKKWNLFCLER